VILSRPAVCLEASGAFAPSLPLTSLLSFEASVLRSLFSLKASALRSLYSLKGERTLRRAYVAALLSLKASVLRPLLLPKASVLRSLLSLKASVSRPLLSPEASVLRPAAYANGERTLRRGQVKDMLCVAASAACCTCQQVKVKTVVKKSVKTVVKIRSASLRPPLAAPVSR
jgi:hypothetical protein